MSFTPGNIVVLRAGNGTAATAASAVAVFLDEYTPGGVLVQSVPLPTADSGLNQTLTLTNNSTTEGLLTRSADGQYLVLAGYDAAVGTTSVAATTTTAVTRVIGRVGADGTVDTTTTTTTYSGGNIRGVASLDGTQFWESGSNGGLVYETLGQTGPATSIAGTPANDRAVGIFGGQLYFGSGSAGFVGIDQVGTGTPTTGSQTVTLLTGTSSTNPYQFFFADLSTSVAGVDTLYVADNAAANGLEKFSLVNGSWVLNNKITVPTGMIGLTGSVSGSSAALFITTSAGLYTLTDSAGYNANDNGTATQIATAAANTAFRGVALAPQAIVATTETIAVDPGSASLSQNEGDSGTTLFTYTLTRTGSLAAAASVHYAVTAAAGTTALDASDFVAGLPQGNVTFAAGSATATVPVQVAGDRMIEANEGFTLTLSAPSNGYAVSTTAGTASGTIVNDDGTVIPAGSFTTSFAASSATSYELLAGATRTETANAVGVSVSANGASVDIEGTLQGFAGARAIDASTTATGDRVLVGDGGAVLSTNGDAIRFRAPTGSYTVTNLGQIVVANGNASPTVGGTNLGNAHGVVLTAVQGAAGAAASDYTSGGTVTNGSATNTAALIRSGAGDAVRLGSHQTLVNYGAIDANGPINDSSTNNAFRAAGSNSTATTYGISRGVRIDDDGTAGSNQGKSVRIDNFGTIAGAQHGVDFGDADSANSVVVNENGALIVGRNGSGVGADTLGAAASTITVINSGTIRGERAVTVVDRAGYTYTDGTGDSDGDGVDIDGGGTVINNAGASIIGAGASGYDSGGRANVSEGLSLGGGVVVNAGTILGADVGITVNNDGTADGSRSGVAATSITNNAGGTITGGAGYAIRLENKTGTAIDADQVTNYGTITGNGTVPTGTVLRQDGSADPIGGTATLDGTTYTGADSGSARFIRGDGAAIQTGEGADVVANYGAVIGNSGRAINLEGGNDTLTLFTGESITAASTAARARTRWSSGPTTAPCRAGAPPATMAASRRVCWQA